MKKERATGTGMQESEGQEGREDGYSLRPSPNSPAWAAANRHFVYFDSNLNFIRSIALVLHKPSRDHPRADPCTTSTHAYFLSAFLVLL